MTSCASTLLTTISVLILTLPVSTFAHPHAILACGVIKQAAPLGEPKVIESNGLIAEDYDTNADGQVDIVTLSTPEGDGRADTKHKPHPLFYVVDFDNDGNPDAIFVDRGEGGKCDEIVLYQDLTTPQSTGQGRPALERGKAL